MEALSLSYVQLDVCIDGQGCLTEHEVIATHGPTLLLSLIVILRSDSASFNAYLESQADLENVMK